MKGMQKIVRGDNFRGVLDYAFDRDKNEEKAEGFIVGGNMSGTDAKELTAEFLRFSDKRKDIKKPVWHNSLRVPVGDDLTDDEWNTVGFDYMERMGFDPKLNQFVFIKHNDEEGKHIHIIASRIDMLGNVWLGRNENIISTRIISELEIDHNLTQTKNLDYTKDEQGNYHIAERSPGRGRTLSRAEELMRNRKQWAGEDYVLPKQRLINAVSAALENQPTTEQFINTLEAQNIQVQCVVKKVQDKKQMVGFSFAIDGENFKGSQVGANWKDITNERKLNYEQERDAEIITNRIYGASNKQTRVNDSRLETGSKPVKQPRKQRAVADTGNLERDSRGRFIPGSQPEISNNKLQDSERQSSVHAQNDDEQVENDGNSRGSVIAPDSAPNHRSGLQNESTTQRDNRDNQVTQDPERCTIEGTGEGNKQPSNHIKPNTATDANKAVINALFDDVDDGVKVVTTLDALDKMDEADVAKAKALGATLVEVASQETRELAQAGTNVVEAFELPAELIINYGQTDYETELEDKKPQHIKDREKSVFNPSTPGQTQGFNPSPPGPKLAVQSYEKTLGRLSDERKAKLEAKATLKFKVDDIADDR